MRYTPTDITSTYAAIAALNANFDEIQALLEKCLFTDGTAPNQMEAVLDMNHFNIQNVAEPVNPNDAIRLADLTAALPSLADAVLFNTTGKVDSRANLAALSQHASKFTVMLTEAGREGLFVFNNSDLSDEVAADTAQGIYIAPADDPTGNSGAWVRPFSGPVNPLWFGVIEGDNSANGTGNSTAINSMLAVMGVLGTLNVMFPGGIYWFGSTIDLNLGNMVFEGGGAGGFASTSTSTSVLKFPAGVTGIRLQGFQSSGALTKDAVAHSDAKGTVLRNLTLKGSFTTTEAEAHGVQFRTMGSIENLTIENFQGDGIHIAGWLGAADGADPPFGNTNNSVIKNVSVGNCRNGIYFNGQDANDTTITGGTFFANRKWGILDLSEFGQTFLGGNLTANGITTSNNGVILGATEVSFNGNIYGCIAGQEAGASTNAPSGTATDNTWWYYLFAGTPTAGRPAWTNGMLVQSGGAVYGNSGLTGALYVGVYAEGDQGKAQLSEPSLVLGGLLASWVADIAGTGSVSGPRIRSGLDISTAGSSVIAEPCFRVNSGGVAIQLGNGRLNTTDRIFDLNHPTLGEQQFRYHTGLGDLIWCRADGTNITYHITTTSTTSGFGTGASVADAFSANKLMVQDNASSMSNARRIMIDSAAPASGAHGQGEWQFDRSASTTIIGNKCTTAGTPGTWSPLFGLTAAPAAIATSGSGADLVASSVTFAKFQTIAANSLVGNPTGSTATVQAITLAGGLSFSGTTLTAAGALTPTSVVSSGGITSNSASAGIGYSTGAGGTVTQITGRTTGVTLNKTCGAITLVSAAGSATWTTFTVTNSSVGANDVIDICQKSGANLYSAVVTAVAAGSFNVSISAVSGTATESPVFNFVVTKSVTA